MASAVDKTGTELPLAADRACIIDRRGRHMVAVARKLLTLVYYGLRDGEPRGACVMTPPLGVVAHLIDPSHLLDLASAIRC